MTEFMFQKPSEPHERSTTISLTECDLRAATQLLRAIVESGIVATHRAASDAPPPPPRGVDRHALADRARRLYSLRRRRAQIFGKGMFGEPAWDVLIALYMDDASGPRATVGRLSELAETPLTTAIRWLDYLEQQGLVRREPHPTDRRAVNVELSDKGRTYMEEFLSDTGL